MALGEKEQLLKEVGKERDVWRQRDRALAAVLQEKEALIRCLKEELESRQKDSQVIYIHKSVTSAGEHTLLQFQFDFLIKIFLNMILLLSSQRKLHINKIKTLEAHLRRLQLSINNSTHSNNLTSSAASAMQGFHLSGYTQVPVPCWWRLLGLYAG